ncbi:MAG: hypothetical protein RL497_2004 [Pseudomonadota bacterium]|jgi:hypothetical protein
MRVLSFFIFAVCLSACGDKTAGPQGVLSTGQEKVLKDAKAVENKLLDADAQRRKNLDGAAE